MSDRARTSMQPATDLDATSSAAGVAVPAKALAVVSILVLLVLLVILRSYTGAMT